MSIVETIIDILAEHKKIFGEQNSIIKVKSVFAQLIELSQRGNEISEQNVNYALSLCFEGKKAFIRKV